MTVTVIETRSGVPRPLGRTIINHDPRNLEPRHLALVGPPVARRRNNRVPHGRRSVFDQSVPLNVERWDGSSCTAQAATGLLHTTPHLHDHLPQRRLLDDPVERFMLYREAQKNDPWPGSEYEGSSTDAPFRVLRSRGLISGWRWLRGSAEVREYLRDYAPVAVGTRWDWDMFEPDRKGFVHLGGGQAGGHAYELVFDSERLDAARIVNSWGKDWGQSGRAWISWKDLDELLQDSGEAVVVAP